MSQVQNKQEYENAAKSACDMHGQCMGKSHRNYKAWQKKHSLPQVEGTWEAY